MKQYIEVASTQMRDVVGALLKLGKLGAYQDETCAGFKIGAMFVCKVVINDDSEVEYGPIVKKGPSKVDDSLPEVVVTKVVDGEVYTKETLEEMSLADLRKLTGQKSGGKQELIEMYLGTLSQE